MRDKKKKCLCKDCEDCNWFRFKQMEKVENGKPTGMHEMIKLCLHEYYFDALNFLMGSYDGLQRGVNEARNRSYETQAVLSAFGKQLGVYLNEIKRVSGVPEAEIERIEE